MSFTSEDIDFLLFSGKTCSACVDTFPANSEHFDRDKSRDDGLKSRCKRCVSLAGKAVYRRDPAKYAEKLRRARERYRQQRAAG